MMVGQPQKNMIVIKEGKMAMYTQKRYLKSHINKKEWKRCKKCGVVINSKYQYCLKCAKSIGFIANNHD